MGVLERYQKCSISTSSTNRVGKVHGVFCERIVISQFGLFLVPDREKTRKSVRGELLMGMVGNVENVMLELSRKVLLKLVSPWFKI